MSRDGNWRRERLVGARLYVCVGLRHHQPEMARFLDAVLAVGVDVVQLRDKHASEDALRTGAGVFRAAAERHGALFIVNDDPWLAAEVDADGVHVGQDDPPPDQARAVVGTGRLVGHSTHSAEQIDRALGEDCDYFAVGPVHATPTKKGRPGIGLGPVRHAAAVGDRPWFVTGGMAPDSAGEVLAAGASRLVVVRAIVEAADPAAAAGTLSGLLGR